jgi:drug/metabolite transporter (DMT)-like permease
MSEWRGVGVAILSCCFGGGAAVATRYLVGAADPFTLAAIRFGGGVLCLLPLLFLVSVRWPSREDWPAVAGLGVLFYALFFVLYNLALGYTTVARGTLALSNLPLMTMIAGRVLGFEPLGVRKMAGVAVAMLGVAVALSAGLRDAPAGAWRGDLIMVSATLCMALYNVATRPFIERSSALGFLIGGMAAGGGAIAVFSSVTGGAAAIAGFGVREALAAAYLAVGGGALAFFLWVYALQHASPTRVANTMTINPAVAGVVAAMLLDEPVTAALVLGLIAVFAGIWLSTTEGRAA